MAYVLALLSQMLCFSDL